MAVCCFSRPREDHRDSDLASLLEFWFPFEDISLTRRRGTWCDGIPLLRLRDINRNAFVIAGVGYFPHDFSPFEIEYHYNDRRDRLTSRIVLRFGISDHDSGLTTFACSTSPEQVLAQSPCYVRDWAVAVELTPQCTLEEGEQNAEPKLPITGFLKWKLTRGNRVSVVVMCSEDSPRCLDNSSIKFATTYVSRFIDAINEHSARMAFRLCTSQHSAMQMVRSSLQANFHFLRVAIYL